MATIPKERLPDSTLAFALEGYDFTRRRCERYRSQVFEARLLLRRTICMRGADAARVFYDTERFSRAGASPLRSRRTIFGQGGVQGLDGEAHRSRKAMFMSLMTPEAMAELESLVAEEWRRRIDGWQSADEVVLYDEVAQILCRAVCTWASVPLPDSDVGRRAKQMVAMFSAPMAVGPPHWRGRRARSQCEAWLGDVVESVRRGELEAREGHALHTVAWHREPDGELLPPRIAAVELLNVIRPTVAIVNFVTLAALALHEHPGSRLRLEQADGTETEMFVQEVRRYYPFFPFVPARVRKDFEWNGVRFPRGRRVLLDLYGTDHDPHHWEEPEEFRPQRFQDWEPDAFTFVAQGGGDHFADHRCAGEWVTIRLMRVAVTAMTAWMTYDVPHQDLYVTMRKPPTGPRSGFVIKDVQATEPGGTAGR